MYWADLKRMPDSRIKTHFQQDCPLIQRCVCVRFSFQLLLGLLPKGYILGDIAFSSSSPICLAQSSEHILYLWSLIIPHNKLISDSNLLGVRLNRPHVIASDAE